MQKETPLINQKYQLEKFPGKGGWTYAKIPEILPDKHAYFGWVRVKGTIDSFEIKNYHLMPMGNGSLFLPVKAQIRKAIDKKEGDWVTISLYPDNEPMEIPQELIDCLQLEPQALSFFNKIAESERKWYIQWIYSAKRDETKANRIAVTIDKLLNSKKFHEK